MLITNSVPDIFNIPKNITLGGKNYTLTFIPGDKLFMNIKINGQVVHAAVKEEEVKNLTLIFKEQVKMAVIEYERVLKQQQDYTSWDGNLD